MRLGPLVVTLILGLQAGGCTGDGRTAMERRVDYRCPGGETISAVFAADGQSVTLIVGDTTRRLEAAEGGKYFTADAVFFGDDPETGAYVAEGETVVLQDCRPAPA